MSDTNPGEKPVNDGGGNAPEPPPAESDAEARDAEKPANQGGGSN
jgi:hypothetical protein